MRLHLFHKFGNWYLAKTITPQQGSMSKYLVRRVYYRTCSVCGYLQSKNETIPL